MAQRVQVILVCDLHDDETPGTETITIGLDGATYELDVCDAHAAEIRDGLSRYVGVARRGSGRNGGRSSSARSGSGRRRSRRGGGDAAQIREWARSQGLPVPERGRIPADLAEKYAAAHG